MQMTTLRNQPTCPSPHTMSNKISSKGKILCPFAKHGLDLIKRYVATAATAKTFLNDGVADSIPSEVDPFEVGSASRHDDPCRNYHNKKRYQEPKG